MSPENRTAYDNARKYYDADLKYYNQEQDLLQKVKNWIQEHTTESKRRFLVPTDSVTEWIRQLKVDCQPPEGYMLESARTKYQTAIKSKTKLHTWVDQWEAAMEEAIEYELPEVTTGGQWLRDLSHAIRHISDGKATIFDQEAKDPELQKVRVRFREIANELRRMQPRPTGGRTQRGNAFNAFAGGEEAPPDEGAKENTGPTGAASNSRKRARTRSRDAQTSKRTAHEGCEACGLRGHTLEQCWFIFESLIPSGRTVDPKRKAKTEKLLAGSEELQAKVEEIRGKMATL